jgi:hypothetical protein
LKTSEIAKINIKKWVATKKIDIFVYIILKKKLNKKKDIERLSVEVAGFIMI